jgi:hypothetical protein
MNTPILTPGMKIVHPNHGEGIVEKVSTGSAEIRFGNVLRTIDPRLADIKVPEPTIKIGEADVPLKKFIEGIVEATVDHLGIEQPDTVVSELGLRWQNGKIVMHPADPTLQTKEVPLDGPQSTPRAGTKNQRSREIERRGKSRDAAIYHALLRFVDNVQCVVQGKGRSVLNEIKKSHSGNYAPHTQTVSLELASLNRWDSCS